MAVVDEQLLFNPFCLPRLQGKTEETTNHDMFFLTHHFMAATTCVGGSEVQRSPVEVGSLSTIISKVLYGCFQK